MEKNKNCVKIVCVDDFSVTVTKHHDRGTFRRKSFFWLRTGSTEVECITAGKNSSRQQAEQKPPAHNLYQAWSTQKEVEAAQGFSSQSPPPEHASSCKAASPTPPPTTTSWRPGVHIPKIVRDMSLSNHPVMTKATTTQEWCGASIKVTDWEVSPAEQGAQHTQSTQFQQEQKHNGKEQPFQ